MNKALIIAVATTSLIVMTATDAFAWERHGTVTGSGGYSRSVTGSGSCSGGSCNNSRQVTGPGGYSRTRQGKFRAILMGAGRGTVRSPAAMAIK